MLVLGLCASTLRADAWVERMLETKTHDFGALRCGADAVYRFPIKNLYQHDVEISQVRSSCGCTDATIDNKSLRPNEIGYVVASFNTRTYAGSHHATLTIEAAWNDGGVRRTGEAQVTVQGTVEGDIVLEPRAVEFGDVPHGHEREETVRVSATSASDWKIEKVKCDCEHLSVRLGQPICASERVIYDALVRLTGGAPPGPIRERLLFVTNDGAQASIPIQVSGRVVPQFWVSPESLFFGEVATGGTISKRIIVRSKEPSRIRSCESDSKCFQCKTDDAASTRHIVEITFQAKEPGQAKQLITVTSQAGHTATIPAYVKTVPASHR